MHFRSRVSTLLSLCLALPVASLGVSGQALASTSGFRLAPPEEGPAEGEAPPPGGSADDLEEEAMTLFQAGQIAFRARDFRRALEFFQDAQSRHPSPIFHYNIGLCYEALERPEQAIDAYNAYLRSGPEDRPEVEQRIAKLEAKIAEAKAAADAEAETTAEAETGEGTAGEGTETTPAPEGPEVSGAVGSEPVDDTPQKPGNGLLIGGAVLAGTGVALVGVGAWQGVRAGRIGDDVDTVMNEGNPEGLTLAETQALDDDGRRAQTIQIATLAAGSILGVTGIALIALGITKNKKAARSANVFVTPVAGRNGSGVSISGRF